MKNKAEINFTKLALMSLPLPLKRESVFYDSKEKGLSLYVYSSGHKSFVVRKRIQGQDRRIILGHFPDITVEQARKAAQKIKGEIAIGKDPYEEKRKLCREKTFGEAFQMYMDRYAKIENKITSQNDAVLRMKKVLPIFGKKHLSSITKYMIQELHDKIGAQNGKYVANRVLAYISSIYNKMISWGWEGENPTIGVSRFKEQKRDRFILESELPKLIHSLQQESDRDIHDFFLLCLYTGARRSNVLAMRWEEIDFDLEEWRIPDTKNGDPVRVPLIRQALEILAYRSFLKETSPWVFPSQKSKTGHLVELQVAWKRVLKRAKLNNLRIHDLRRTNGSYQAINGTSLTIIGKSLGHKSTQSTAIYARLSNDPVRESLERAFNKKFYD